MYRKRAIQQEAHSYFCMTSLINLHQMSPAYGELLPVIFRYVSILTLQRTTMFGSKNKISSWSVKTK
jgi:hypothetical protein